MRSLDTVRLAPHCAVTFHRTLRIPDDGGEYPLPPSLGALPVFPVGGDELVAPMRRTEALWLGFEAPWWRPHALKVGIGGFDAISGEPFDAEGLSTDPQDYVVIPEQPWLDGINCGDGFIRQFVAVPLGEGLTVEAQLSGREVEGGLTLSLFEPRPGRFPLEAPFDDMGFGAVQCCASSMGLGAGGRMRQEIYADEHGSDTWAPKPVRTVHVDLVDSLAFEAVTGLPAPQPVLSARDYTEHGFPWFDLFEPGKRDIAAAGRLAAVRSVADLEGRDEDPLPIPYEQIVRLLRLRAPARG